MWRFTKNPLLFLCCMLLTARAAAQTAGQLSISQASLQEQATLLLNQDIWSIDPDPTDTVSDKAVFGQGTHPRHFITKPQMRRGSKSATFRLTITLDHEAPLSLQIPEYPFYELYLGDRLLVRHGDFPDHPQRLYQQV